MDQLFPVLWWSGPIGIGVFLMGFGVLFWGISKFSKKDDQSKPRSK